MQVRKKVVFIDDRPADVKDHIEFAREYFEVPDVVSRTEGAYDYAWGKLRSDIIVLDMMWKHSPDPKANPKGDRTGSLLLQTARREKIRTPIVFLSQNEIAVTMLDCWPVYTSLRFGESGKMPSGAPNAIELQNELRVWIRTKGTADGKPSAFCELLREIARLTS